MTSIGKGTAYLMIAQISFLVSNYAIHIGLARFLGTATYGIFGVLMSLYLLNRAFLNTGIPRTVSKFIAENKNRGIVWSSFKLQTMFAVLFGTTYYVCAPYIASLLSDTTLTPYIRFLGIMIIPLSWVGWYLNGYFNGTQDFKNQAIIKTIYPVLRVTATLTLVYAGFALWGALWGYMISIIIALMICWMVYPFHKNGHFSTKKIVLFSIPVTISSLGLTSLRNMNVLFIKAYVDNIAAGLYTAASTLSQIPVILFLALPLTLLPTISRSTATKNKQMTIKYIRQSTRYLLILSVPITVYMAVTAERLLIFLYPAEFAQASSILQILMGGSLFLIMFTTLSAVITGSGKPYREMYITVMLAIMLGILNVFLVPIFGGKGAALSYLATTMMAALLAGAYITKKFDRFLSIKSSIKIILAATITGSIGYHWNLAGIWLIPLYISLFIIYGALLLLFGEIKKQDLIIARKLFKSN